ncbi:MAG: hypothetical protein Q7U59_05320 [Lutibacter sp.]|jgi:hypothetical protein|nr:MAG: hypothetical protein APF83_11015 [Lutibacter sp. BRH_c52]MDO9037751.1 hypothetical protein [Lutibacter sp.]HCE54570.1 hypothetical protein [Lutibacter sp.]
MKQFKFFIAIALFVSVFAVSCKETPKEEVPAVEVTVEEEAPAVEVEVAVDTVAVTVEETPAAE